MSLLTYSTETLDKLSPNQYIYLYILYYTSNNRLLDKLRDMLSEEELLHLIKFGYLESIENRHRVTSLFSDSFISKSSYEELYKAYPDKTPEGRKLRITNVKTRELYNEYIGKQRMTHLEIIKALTEEVEYRTKNNSMTYMPNLAKYVKDKLWEVYTKEIRNERIQKSEKANTVFTD